MNPRSIQRRAAAALAWCAVLAGLAGPSDGARDPGTPDILFFLLDDVGYNDVRVVPTPTIDRLAARGASFRRAYSMPTCSPTRYSLLFGLFRGEGSGSSCVDGGQLSPPSSLYSLPKMLKARGYATGGFGKWHLGSNRIGPWELSPHLHGFDVWRAGLPSNVRRCGGSGYEDWLRFDDGASGFETEYQTIAVRDELIAWWLATPAPRFAYVAFQAAHVPLHEPPASILPPGYTVAPSGRGKFEATVASLDFVIGQILENVDLHDTHVIVMGDNGTPPEAPGPGQSRGRVKATTYEGGVHVPLILSGPGIRRLETDSLAHATDLLATVADLVGASVPSGVAVDSRSLVPCLLDPWESVRDFVFCDFVPTATGPGMPGSPSGRDRAIITARWKLRRVGGSVEELFDLELDPHESFPIDPGALAPGSELHEVASRLGKRLDELERR